MDQHDARYNTIVEHERHGSHLSYITVVEFRLMKLSKHWWVTEFL